MKIVLTGAPGAGKSKLAKSLAKKLDGHTVVVDGYIEKLGKATNEEYGIYANYGMNMQAAVARLTAEKEAMAKGADNIIVCGSIVESLVYNGLRTNRDLFENKSDSETQSVLLRIGEGASMGLGVLLTSLVDLQELRFFLPLSEEKLEEYGKTYEVAVDKMVPEALESVQRPFLLLDGSPQQKVKNALLTINKYQSYLASNEASVAQRQGASESGKPDRGTRDEAESVSDVQGKTDGGSRDVPVPG